MYGAVYNTGLVAIHDNFDIVSIFVNSQPNKEEFNIIKIKKKKKNKSELSDLYLTRYNDLYVPYYLFDTMKSMSDEYVSDYKFCKDILYRLLEDRDDLSSKEIKSVIRVISILEDEIDNQDIVSDIRVLKEIKEMDETYRGKMR